MIKFYNPGPVIKAAKLWIVLLSCLAPPTVVFAESALQGNVVNAPTKMENSANIAAGSDNKAVHSSVALKNVRMSGTVANSVQSKTAVNAAAGKRNVANQGSISLSRGKVEGSVLNSVTAKSTSNLAVGSRNQANQSAIISNNSNISGTLLNSSVGNSRVNMAIGTDNKADQGSVRIENSRIRGTVMNTSTMQKSANMAVGKSTSASQAAIVMDGAQLRGIAVNNASGENAVNVAAGYKNQAHQSSIVVDGDKAGKGSAVTLPQDTFPADSGGTGQGEHSIPAYTGRKMMQDRKEQKAAQHVPGQVVFLVDNDKAGLAGLDRVAKKYQLDVGEKTVLKSLNRIMVVSSTAKDAAEIAEALKKEPGVYNSQPNYVFATMGRQDPLSPMQNLVSMLDLQEVHGKVSGKNITVAVVDTGVEVEHQDLRSRIVGYQNFISASAYQGEIHGTAVAGIIGAGKNEYGIVGIAPDVSLLALRACRQVSKLSAVGECFSTSLVGSLDAAISAEVDVVNLSLVAYVNDTLLGMMIDSGYEKGIVFAAPVGNDPDAENIAFPASHDKVISVAGLDEQGNPLPNKRLASMADAVAPATHLFVTTPGNSYNYIDGTSLASAAISGIIALSMENKTARNSPCLPRFNNAVPWPKQVFSCIGL
ncbi:MAG: hypothetical protein VR65_17590 [Desulfobulbaceae bacterium BRH_c16a]|nr:MAG: hypothetical protein VR65_17590 [Desulfobulbaceae bacterium BRH_c16a]